MTWRVLTTPASEPDFQALTAQDRASVVEDLFAWVEDGPPRSGSRLVRGAVLFDDQLPCGYTISYFVNEADRYVAVVRLRRSHARLIGSERQVRYRSGRPAVGLGRGDRPRCRQPGLAPP